MLQQTSQNAKGFGDLAERMKRLAPILLYVNKHEEAIRVSFPILKDLTGCAFVKP